MLLLTLNLRLVEMCYKNIRIIGDTHHILQPAYSPHNPILASLAFFSNSINRS